MVNYQNGKIYKIVNDVTDDIYVDSTIQQLSHRFQDHKGYTIENHWKNNTIIALNQCLIHIVNYNKMIIIIRFQ